MTSAARFEAALTSARAPELRSVAEDPFASGCTDALRFLQSLEGVDPEQALARLPALRALHPELQVELVWEREPYGRTVSYEVLLHSAGADTVTVAYCPDRGLPWPMRGVQRHSEADLVKVDHDMVRVDQAIQLLDFIWEDLRLAHSLVDASLLQQVYSDREIDVSDEELQAGMDDFRRRRGLRTPERTRAWLRRRGISQERLEFFVADRVRLHKLRAQVTADTLDAYFEEHRADFDRVVLGVVALADLAQARALRERAGDSATGLFRAACGRMVTSAPAAASHGQDLLQASRRWEMPPALGREVFSAPVGAVVGPVQDDGVFRVAAVISREPAALDDETREHVAQRLFDAWLDDRRANATIEWHWGREEPASLP